MCNFNKIYLFCLQGRLKVSDDDSKDQMYICVGMKRDVNLNNQLEILKLHSIRSTNHLFLINLGLGFLSHSYVRRKTSREPLLIVSKKVKEKRNRKKKIQRCTVLVSKLFQNWCNLLNTISVIDTLYMFLNIDHIEIISLLSKVEVEISFKSFKGITNNDAHC